MPNRGTSNGCLNNYASPWAVQSICTQSALCAARRPLSTFSRRATNRRASSLHLSATFYLSDILLPPPPPPSWNTRFYCSRGFSRRSICTIFTLKFGILKIRAPRREDDQPVADRGTRRGGIENVRGRRKLTRPTRMSFEP